MAKTKKSKKGRGSDGEAADEKRLYGVVEKGPATRLEVYGASYQGRTSLHVREHYLDDGGEWRPTKKGFTLREGDQIGELVDLLKTAAKDY